MTEEKTTQEEFKIDGKEVVDMVKKLIKEGNVRRFIIKNEKSVTVLEIPVTAAVVGALILPILAAVGAAAALLTKCTLIVERKLQ